MNAGQLARHLTIRVLYPKPEHRDDLVAAIGKVAAAARGFAGLIEIGAWLDEADDRLVSLTLWESREQAMAATQVMHPMFADIPWSEWERRPAENLLGLTRVV